MTQLILAVNAGSSSLKLGLFRSDVAPLSTASFKNIGPQQTTTFSYALSDSEHKSHSPEQVKDHTTAFDYFIQTLFNDPNFTNQGYKRDDITHLCHRVVHGGLFTDPVIIQRHIYVKLEALSDLAPLHNDSALHIIRSAHHSLPNAVSIAFFDSAFHRSLPQHIYTYAISPSVAKEKNLRKYGFHGLSYSYILRTTSTFLNLPISQINLIALHLGAGASVCAIKNGKSINVSMGLTPLSGLPGATRSGDVDPSLIFHYAGSGEDVARMSHDRVRSLHITEAEKILNTEAGWKALTGTADFKDIATSKKESHRLAFDIFVDRVCQFVGGYFVQLQGNIHAITFSGGLGENSPELRKAIVERCVCLGFDTLDDKKNTEKPGGVWHVGAGDGRVRVLVCETNEEEEIARQCASRDEFWFKGKH
ncbi:Acetokinase family-domain-containing protein [Hysterangium stoloniferum]|nr:Acetokinase family-domain-containing protein [Hysterangium stoloniferum]